MQTGARVDIRESATAWQLKARALALSTIVPIPLNIKPNSEAGLIVATISQP
ncbi:MAG TPA: hypothetical protein VFD66_08885 [Verrucomicrobiae bacterium]|nr:hypothetical protein [Verrucomicrobiae bacterium]